MSVYNGADYLECALESIRLQDYSNFELVVVNDGSKDNSLEIIEEFKKKVQFQVVIINKTNSGLTKSLNVGLYHCTGDYIVRHDADDVSERNRLSILNEFISNDIDFYTTKSKIFDMSGCLGVLPKSYITNKNAFNLELLSYGNFHIHGTFCIKREVLEKYLYDESVRFAQDFDLIIRLICNGVSMKYIPLVTYQLRLQNDSISKTNTIAQRDCLAMILNRYTGGPIKKNKFFKLISLIKSSV